MLLFPPLLYSRGLCTAAKNSSDSVSTSCCEPSGVSGVFGAYHPGGHPAGEPALAGPGRAGPGSPPLASLWPGALARLLLVVWLGGWAADGAR